MKKFFIMTLFITINSEAVPYLVKENGAWKRISLVEKTFNADWIEIDQRLKLPRVKILSIDDPRVGEQWSLKKSMVLDTISLAQRRQKLKEVIVAVIDTGVDLKHPDLRGNIFTNVNEIPDNGKDDDKNGFVDDVHGWNFAAHEDDRDADPISEQNNAQDDFQHGTHVAGIIGAIQNNQIGITGIVPNVKILPLRWMKKGLGWGSDAIAAIRYATQMGAKVINASWGGIGYSKALEEAVREAESKGVLFVVSAGNNGENNDTTPRHPANLRFSNVIAVANTNEGDDLAKSSNFGAKQVELAAPGENIVSTIMGGKYGVMGGTSMSAAHVSGIAALLISVHPELGAQEIKKILMKTVSRLQELETKTISGGRIHALNALKLADAEKVKPFYEFGEVDVRPLMNSGFIRPDRIEDGASVSGIELKFVRMVAGQETPVPGIAFRGLVSDENGRVSSGQCWKKEMNITATLESDRVSVMGDRSPYDLLFKIKCNVAQKMIFDEKSEAGEVIGIWQVANHGLKKIENEVGLDFWKDRIEFQWPAQGDYYDGYAVHITRGYQWDVVSHEMGHAIYDRANIGAAGGGEHYIDRCYDEALALSEGWASFYASWLNFELDDADPGFEYMVPRRAPIKFENIPADVCGKSTNEWRVNGFLWDLIDTHRDHEAFAQTFSALWRNTKNMRAPSALSIKSHLINEGWDSASLNSIWKLNFPAE